MPRPGSLRRGRIPDCDETVASLCTQNDLTDEQCADFFCHQDNQTAYRARDLAALYRRTRYGAVTAVTRSRRVSVDDRRTAHRTMLYPSRCSTAPLSDKTTSHVWGVE